MDCGNGGIYEVNKLEKHGNVFRIKQAAWCTWYSLMERRIRQALWCFVVGKTTLFQLLVSTDQGWLTENLSYINGNTTARKEKDAEFEKVPYIGRALSSATTTCYHIDGAEKREYPSILYRSGLKTIACWSQSRKSLMVCMNWNIAENCDKHQNETSGTLQMVKIILHGWAFIHDSGSIYFFCWWTDWRSILKIGSWSIK